MVVKNKKAFTLIELIMTIVLIGIVVIPSSIFLAESIRGAFKSEDIIVAINLARMEIERTNNMTYEEINPIDITNYWGDDLSHPSLSRYDLRRQVTVIERKGKESVKEIKIEVYPTGMLGNAGELLTAVITHRAQNVE